MAHVTLSLERARVSTATGDEFSRDLARVLFATESFQLHMERLPALEELNAYMVVVSQLHPQFTDKVNELKEIHEKLREATRQFGSTAKACVPNSVWDIRRDL